MKKDPDFCEHSIRTKFCSICIAKKAASASINDKILNVLKDNMWHTQREIAEKAGLVAGDNYVDIGRDIRSLRNGTSDEENRHLGTGPILGENPIDERHVSDNLHEYRLLTMEEAASSGYWNDRRDRLAKVSKNRIRDLEAEVARLRDENSKLAEANKALEEYMEASTAPSPTLRQ